jgi:hypothetical protein
MKSRDARELRRLDQITRQLAETKNVKDVKGLRDQAEAVRHYAKTAARGLKFQNEAAVVKLQAERRGGQILIEMAPHGGDHKSKRDGHTKLRDLGITRNQSARWRQIAAVPEDAFQRYVAKTTDHEEEITDRGLLKFARQHPAAQESGRKRAHGSRAATNGEVFSVDGNGAFSTPTDETSDAQQFSDIVNDMDNHRVLMENILAPLEDRKKGSITRAECRHVLHLLQEFGVLIGNLRRLAAHGCR